MEQYYEAGPAEGGPGEGMPPPGGPAPGRPPYAAMYQPKKTGTGKTILFVIAALFLLGSLFLNVMLFVMLIGATLGGTLGEKLNEVYVTGDKSARDAIAVVDVRGLIFDEDMFGRGVVKDVKEKLDRAGDSDNVKAIILAVDSPGGSITASDILHRKIQQVKAESNKKIVVLMKNVGASGGYYISVPADYIVAYPTTITGSIGVVVSTLNYQGLFDKIGLKEVVIKSGEKKDMLSGAREITEEERKIITDIVMEMHQRFVTIVADGRKLAVPEVEKLADGRIFSASQALKEKLIDEIGYFEDAEAAAKKLAGLSQYRVIRYERPKTFMESLLEGYAGAPRRVSIEDFLPKDRVSFMYLWQSGY